MRLFHLAICAACLFGLWLAWPAQAAALAPPALLPGQSLVLSGAHVADARVLVEVEVNRSGAEVVDLAGAVPADRDELERAAQAHASQLRFVPAQKEGASIAARIRIELPAQARSPHSPTHGDGPAKLPFANPRDLLNESSDTP